MTARAWKTGVSGLWQDAANWTNGVPGDGDAATLIGIGSSATNTGTITDVSLNMMDESSWDIRPLSAFDNQGTMLASAGGAVSLRFGYLGPTQTIYNEGLIAGAPGAGIGFASYSNAPLNIHYGLLVNSGTIDANGGGVGINADVTQTATGVIEIDKGGSLGVNAILRGGLLKLNSAHVSFGMQGGHGDMGRSVSALSLTSDVEFDGPADLSFIKPITRLDFDPTTDTLAVIGAELNAGLATLHLVGSYTADEFSITPDKLHLAFTPTAPIVQPPPVVDPPPAPKCAILDTTTNTHSTAEGDAYSGPVAGLNWQYLDLSPHNLNITATVPNAFIHSGSGQDAIDVSHANGTNVLDGGTGSNFLVGGNGTDTFFLDDRGPSAPLWSTLVNFHAGDAATVWGLTANDFQVQTADNQGADGFAGLTFHFPNASQPIASLTLPGFSSADLSSGRVAMSYGRTGDLPGLSGSDYLSIHAA